MIQRTLRSRPLFLVVAIWAIALVPGCDSGIGAQTAPLPASLELERAFPALSFQRPVLLTHAGDGSGRLFVVQQAGQILTFPNQPSVSNAQVFLDIRSRVSTAGNEEGLLGLAFDPQFAENGHFYVYYSAANPRRSVLSRFSVERGANAAVTSSELVLLEVPQPFANHNGGMIAFGPEGYLYVALGDGGSAGDPQGNGQNPRTLLGSILRIDVTGATTGQPYRIPPDNPFADGTEGRPEVWAYGLRNPWRFSFDPELGDLWAGDVGQNDVEEIDIIRKGLNYGWNVVEGLDCFRASTCDRNGLEPPIAQYRHQEGCSVTGGYVYRGGRRPDLQGVYLYADFCSGRIWGLRKDELGTVGPAQLVRADFQIPSFGIDEANEVYVLGFDGGIYRFVAPEPAPTPTPTPSPTSTPSPTATSTSTPTLPPATTSAPSLTPDATSSPPRPSETPTQTSPQATTPTATATPAQATPTLGSATTPSVTQLAPTPTASQTVGNPNSGGPPNPLLLIGIVGGLIALIVVARVLYRPG